jgi:soluble lytic murein transglycosylase
MSKKILFFILLFNLAGYTGLASSEMVPLKKPIQTKEETQKKLLIDVLKPLPKPIETTEKKVIKEKITAKKEKKSDLIIPKKKPLIAGTEKVKDVKISKYYNKKDFNLAKKAVSEMKKAKWTDALSTSKKAKDKSIYNFIQWRHLLRKGNQASYYDYKAFIDKNENYPRIGRIKYLAEHKLSTDKISPKKIIDWYGSSEPLSGFGKMILGESFILTGNKEKGAQLIKEGWITAELTKSELRFYRKKFKKYLEANDYINRADYLAWNNKYWDLKRGNY